MLTLCKIIRKTRKYALPLTFEMISSCKHIKVIDAKKGFKYCSVCDFSTQCFSEAFLLCLVTLTKLTVLFQCLILNDAYSCHAVNGS